MLNLQVEIGGMVLKNPVMPALSLEEGASLL
jgi:hypothetical protein